MPRRPWFLALRLPVIFLLVTAIAATASAADEDDLSLFTLPPADLINDPAVELTQATGRRAAPRTETPALAQAGRAAAQTVGSVSLASVPYMIGDTGSGTCLGFQGLLQARLSHPSLTCARLNIAEANSPLPTNRLYYSYRHFHKASTISAYQFSETLDLDRHLIAWENTFWDDMASVELRLPIEQRMRSQIFSIIAPNSGVVDPLVAPGDGRDTELGNIAGIFKYLLVERDGFALSAGIGVTAPTAQDVEYNLAVDGIITFPNAPGIIADEAAAFQGVFGNETIYLEPFLAWIVRPSSNWFHQGFLQIEVAANPSRVTFDGDGATLFLDANDPNVPVGFYDYFTPTPARVELFSQTLMRLNLGLGYFLVDRPQERGLQHLVALAEMHYTTTLQDAILSDVPLTVQSSVGSVPLQQITVGNGLNRSDLVNAALGVAAHYGDWILTNGFIAPLRRDQDRGFDFEYNLQVQRLF